MRLVRLMLVLGWIGLFLLGCTEQPAPSGDEQKAADALASRGYTVTSRLGEVDSHTLDREMLATSPHREIWAVQKTDPASHFGKTITTYGFIVSGHPLEDEYASALKKRKFAIQVNVMLADGEVIGGTSFPVSKGDELLMGAPYALDGESLEDVTGKSYGEWLEEWSARYGES